MIHRTVVIFRRVAMLVVFQYPVSMLQSVAGILNSGKASTGAKKFAEKLAVRTNVISVPM